MKRILTEQGHDPNVAHQVADMVSGAVHRALRQLAGAAPAMPLPMSEGGQCKFPPRTAAEVGPNPDVVSHVAIPGRPVNPDDAYRDAAGPLERMDEKQGSGNGSMPWVF